MSLEHREMGVCCLQKLSLSQAGEAQRRTAGLCPWLRQLQVVDQALGSAVGRQGESGHRACTCAWGLTQRLGWGEGPDVLPCLLRSPERRGHGVPSLVIRGCLHGSEERKLFTPGHSHFKLLGSSDPQQAHTPPG